MNEILNKILARKFAPYLLIIIVSFFTFAQTLFYDFSFSDDHVLLGYHYEFNKNLSNIGQAFVEDIFKTPMGLGSYYRPMLRLSFMWDAQFGESNVNLMSRFTDLWLHAFSMCFLFILLLKLKIKKRTAFLFTLLLTVHPIMPQTVGLIASRNDSLLAFFALPSFIFLIDYFASKKNKYLIGHLIFFALALFTKETAVVMPAVFAAYILIFIPKDEIKKSWLEHTILFLGWMLLCFLWFQARSIALGHNVAGVEFRIFESLFDNFPVIIPTIGKIFLPFHLSPFPILKDMPMIYGSVVILVMSLWFVLANKKNYKMIIFGLVWFAAFISLALVKPFGAVPEFSEHRMYVPIIGFIFITLGLGSISGLDKFIQKKWPDENIRNDISLALFLGLFLVFMSVSMYRTQYYQDGNTFWANAVETSPSRAFNRNNLGAMYYLNGYSAEAEKEYEIALEVNPMEPLAHYNRGLIYEDKNDLNAAQYEYLMEMYVNRPYPPLYHALGRIYYKRGDVEKAIENWKKSLDLDPGFYEGLNNLAVTYNQLGNIKQAIYYSEEIKKYGYNLDPALERLLLDQGVLK